MIEHFQNLGFDSEIDDIVLIKQNQKKLCLKVHPDKLNNNSIDTQDNINDKFIKINKSQEEIIKQLATNDIEHYQDDQYTTLFNYQKLLKNYDWNCLNCNTMHNEYINQDMTEVIVQCETCSRNYIISTNIEFDI